MFDVLAMILESVPGAPGVPMPLPYSGAGSLSAGPSCSLDPPPPDPGTTDPDTTDPGTTDPPPAEEPFFGARGDDYVSVRALKRMGDTYKQDRSIGNALALLVVLPVMAPLVMLEDTLRNPFPGTTLRAPTAGCPHG